MLKLAAMPKGRGLEMVYFKYKYREGHEFLRPLTGVFTSY
jgi:hypothetical protein